MTGGAAGNEHSNYIAVILFYSFATRMYIFIDRLYYCFLPFYKNETTYGYE